MDSRIVKEQPDVFGARVHLAQHAAFSRNRNGCLGKSKNWMTVYNNSPLILSRSEVFLTQ